MEKYGFVYITTNIINGKRYIGQTAFKLGEKKNNSYLGSGKYLRKAISKYGRESFTREILFIADSFVNLNWAERHFIKEFDAVKSRDFYNVSPGGRASLGFTGKKHSKERNENLSQKLKGHAVNKTTRIAVAKTGKRMCGSNNGRAINIHIFNEQGDIMYHCYGDFEKVCIENELPFLALKGSYLKNGKSIFTSKKSFGRLKDLTMKKYTGWSAKKI
jgi:group I intron endonuclease